MPYDLESLKDKLGDDYDSLKLYVDEITTQKESAQKQLGKLTKQGSDATNKSATLQGYLNTALEKLGIDSVDELDDIQSFAGVSDAAKQASAKAARLERQNAELQKERDAYQKQADDLGKSQAVQKGMRAGLPKGHQWNEGVADLIPSYLGDRIVKDGDTWMVQEDGGYMKTIDEAVAQLAKDRPGLLSSVGTSGTGFSDKQSAGGAQKKLSEMSTGQKSVLKNTNPTLYEQLKNSEA